MNIYYQRIFTVSDVLVELKMLSVIIILQLELVLKLI